MKCSTEDVYRHFWLEIQAVVGLVPISIRRILEVQGYAASSALEDITDLDIEEMEVAMKNYAVHYSKILKPDKLSVLYGIFADNPGQFHFMGGERKCILKAGQVVKRYGIAKFLPTQLISDADSTTLPVLSTEDKPASMQLVDRPKYAVCAKCSKIGVCKAT